jgi:hypothetical protein
MQVHELFNSETQRSQKQYITKMRRGPLFEAAHAVDAGLLGKHRRVYLPLFGLIRNFSPVARLA